MENFATYYATTKRRFNARTGEHLGILTTTGKIAKSDNDSAIKEHILFCNHSSDIEDFSVLTTNNNGFKIILMESLLINRDHPPLNTNKEPLLLEFSDSIWFIIQYNKP